MIGFEPYLPSDEAKAHTHHFIVHECRGAPGEDIGPILEPIMATGGDHCYKPGNFSLIGPQYCRAYLFVWAIGGRRTVFPDHVGYPLGAGSAPEYYMLEIHYDNPAELKLRPFVTGIDIFYSEKLRANEAGTLTIGHDLAVSHLLPPGVQSFLTVGHCGSECTNVGFPADGINVFNVLLHSHLAGRKLKLRHFRDGQELPWVSVDDNYDFDYQQNRPLREEVKFLRGDQLSFECIYDTTSRANVTVGGLASQQEMCQTFIGYYPKTETLFCGSVYSPYDLLPYFGIESVVSSPGDFDPVVTAPPHLAGRTFTDVASSENWTTDKVTEIQQMLRFSPHIGICSGHDSLPDYMSSYVNVTLEYIPPNPCKKI
jgi:dimethyladenosine transferase 1